MERSKMNEPPTVAPRKAFGSGPSPSGQFSLRLAGKTSLELDASPVKTDRVLVGRGLHPAISSSATARACWLFPLLEAALLKASTENRIATAIRGLSTCEDDAAPPQCASFSP